MLRLHEGGERIPLTVADFDRERGTITMVIQALGKTTREMRDHYKAGRQLRRLRRPARPAAARRARSGTWCWSAAASAWRRSTRSCAPSRRRATAPPASSASATRTWSSGRRSSRSYCDELIVCTDDGSYGKPGFVTAALKEVLRERQAGSGGRHRAAADDERLRRDHAALRRARPWCRSTPSWSTAPACAAPAASRSAAR